MEFGQCDTPSTSSSSIENTASRTIQELYLRMAAGDLAAAVERFVARDIEHVSRRRIVGSPGYRGRETYVDRAAVMLEMCSGVTLDPIAVRGERLVLARAHYASAGGFELVMLHLSETDAAGALAYWVTFDEEDREAAFDELDARYAEIVSTPGS